MAQAESNPGNPGTEDQKGSQLQGNLEVIRARYGIVVELDQVSSRRVDRLGFTRNVSYDTVPYSNAALPIRTIRQELALYPPKYIHATRLRRIRPVKGLRESSFAVGQVQDIGGIPIPKQGLLYLDIGIGGTSMLDFRQSLHHELSHFSDDDISGIRGRKKRRAWVALNPEGSKAYRIVPEYFSNRDLDHERPEGFASLYGTFSPEEDRAEIAQLIFIMGHVPSYLKNLMQKDEVLKAKILVLLSELNEKSGRVSESYLEDLEARIVNEEYWDSN